MNDIRVCGCIVWFKQPVQLIKEAGGPNKSTIHAKRPGVLHSLFDVFIECKRMPSGKCGLYALVVP